MLLKTFLKTRYKIFTSVLFLFALAVVVQAVDLTEKTTLGGYGELHFNYVKPKESVSSAPILDFHRWVIFLNHNWTNRWSFVSELELEHNFIEGGKATGELELEQAYIQLNTRPEINFQVGVLLPSVGLQNDKHEPNLFLSVERPDYSKVIIPTTWYGNGVALRGLILDALAYNVVVMEGLDDRKFLAKDGIRSGRQKGFKSSLETVLVNTAIDYVAIPGFYAGASLAINVLAHDPTNTHPYSSTLLGEAHALYKKNGLWIQTEFGTISYKRQDSFVVPLKNSMGFYADIGYDIARFWKDDTLKLYPFIRYSQYNSANNLGVNGTVSMPTFGVALFPLPKIAFKVDYSIESKKGAPLSVGIFNIGAGYVF